jgi:two-component system, cell cycle sensor histidine kinase and response regulator CckA
MHAPPIKTILLLDDEPAVLQITAMMLRGTGEWNVLEARSLQEATDKAKSHIDLVIADVCIDAQDPSAVATQLGVLYPHVRVLFISGYPQDHLLGNGLLNSGADFLAKPFSPDLLLRCVRNILDAEIAGPRTLRAAG